MNYMDLPACMPANSLAQRQEAIRITTRTDGTRQSPMVDYYIFPGDSPIVIRVESAGTDPLNREISVSVSSLNPATIEKIATQLRVSAESDLTLYTNDQQEPQ